MIGAMLCEREANTDTTTTTTAKKGRVQTILRVAQGERFVGDVLLDEQGRVWRHADTIPADVVLKALLAFTRQGEVCGTVRPRKGGRDFAWFVVGALAEEHATEVVPALAGAAA